MRAYYLYLASGLLVASICVAAMCVPGLIGGAVQGRWDVVAFLLAVMVFTGITARVAVLLKQRASADLHPTFTPHMNTLMIIAAAMLGTYALFAWVKS